LDIIKYYIVAATKLEVQPFIHHCNSSYKIISEYVYAINATTHIHVLIHGVGAHSANYCIQQYCKQSPALIIQAGIAGSFNPQLGLGNVYFVGNDRFADIGIEDDLQFVDIFETKLIDGHSFPYTNGWLFNTEMPYPVFFTGLMNVSALTVNTVSGNQHTINQLTSKYKASLESMEGAALHYVCLLEKIAFVQLRAVSNYVEIRDKSKWNIALAVENLNNTLIEFVQTL
jgi:futalosine hydrolase